MKRRTNFDSIKIRKSIRRSRLTEGFYGRLLIDERKQKMYI